MRINQTECQRYHHIINGSILQILIHIKGYRRHHSCRWLFHTLALMSSRSYSYLWVFKILRYFNGPHKCDNIYGISQDEVQITSVLSVTFSGPSLWRLPNGFFRIDIWTDSKMLKDLLSLLKLKAKVSWWFYLDNKVKTIKSVVTYFLRKLGFTRNTQSW